MTRRFPAGREPGIDRFLECGFEPCQVIAKQALQLRQATSQPRILGGAMGETELDPAGVKAVAAMPSREELIATIAGMIGAPASNIAGAIGAPASNIASILSTIEDKAA